MPRNACGVEARGALGPPLSEPEMRAPSSGTYSMLEIRPAQLPFDTLCRMVRRRVTLLAGPTRTTQRHCRESTRRTQAGRGRRKRAMTSAPDLSELSSMFPCALRSARSPGQDACCTGPVVEPRSDTRHLDWRNGFEAPTSRTPGDNHAARACDRTGQRLPIGNERFGHNASTVGFQRRHRLASRSSRATPSGAPDRPPLQQRYRSAW